MTEEQVLFNEMADGLTKLHAENSDLQAETKLLNTLVKDILQHNETPEAIEEMIQEFYDNIDDELKRT